MATFWSALKEAFDEGRDEGAHGAPTDKLVDTMMLAARADRNVTREELARIARLLVRHFRTFESVPDAEVSAALHDAVARLDAMGEPAAQLAQVAAALREDGVFACEKGYALAYAILLADHDLNPPERAFADRLRQALGVAPERALEIERDLAAANAG